MKKILYIPSWYPTDEDKIKGNKFQFTRLLYLWPDAYPSLQKQKPLSTLAHILGRIHTQVYIHNLESSRLSKLTAATLGELEYK